MSAKRLTMIAVGVLIVVSIFGVSHEQRVSGRVSVSVSTTVATTTTTSSTTTSAPPRVVPRRASRGAVHSRGHVSVDEATRQRVIAAIYAYDDWDAARMVRIAMCESGLNPWAVNGSHHGIFQIVGATLGLIEEHVALAHSMWQHRGYQPWECRG